MPMTYGRYGPITTIKTWSYAGFTTQDGGLICEDCADHPSESEQDEQGLFPIFADSEWDYMPACEECGVEFDYVTVLDEEE